MWVGMPGLIRDSFILTFLLNVRIVFYMFGLLVCSSFACIDKLVSRPLTVVIYNVSIVYCDIFTVIALIFDLAHVRYIKILT